MLRSAWPAIPGACGSTTSNRVVGLNFAGDDDGKQAIANPIGAVLEALNINLRVGITMHGFVAITTNLLL